MYVDLVHVNYPWPAQIEDFFHFNLIVCKDKVRIKFSKMVKID
jgi:hypothetical protein